MEKTYKLQGNEWISELPLTKEQRKELKVNRELREKESKEARNEMKKELEAEKLLTKEERKALKAKKAEKKEKKIAKLEIKPVTEKPKKEHKKQLKEIWDKHKPVEEDAEIIHTSITIDSNGNARGIINYRVKGEHRQKRI